MIIKEMMSQYDELRFINDDGTLNLLASPAYSTAILEKHGFIMNGKLQKTIDFSIFPIDYFCPQDYETGILNVTENTFSIHHYAATWHTKLDAMVIAIERFGKKRGRYVYKLSRCISFPLRVLNKIKKNGLKKTMSFIKKKLF